MGAATAVRAEPVQIPVGPAALQGDLVVPAGAAGAVLFAHGTGSGRKSPRNRYVARALQHAGLATLLIDLLTLEEEAVDLQTAQFRFNIDLLAERLDDAVMWLVTSPLTRNLRVGLFGASTGAAAALVAASRRPEVVGAIVSRGGRPDLAGRALLRVRAPTLLIVGGADTAVIALNREAFLNLRGTKRIAVVHGATHLFEEAGALKQVASLASEWFLRYLTPVSGCAS
jgi:putative phosphoribosyl transferase